MRPIPGAIDQVPARYHWFTQEKLDFIIYYDLKHRMGREIEEAE